MILGKVHPVVFYPDSILLQPPALLIHAAEGIMPGQFSLGIDHFVAGENHAIRVFVEHIAHSPGQMRVTQIPGDLPVGHHISFWDPGEIVIDRLLHRGVLSG